MSRGHKRSRDARRRTFARRRAQRFRALKKRDPYARGERPDLWQQDEDQPDDAA